MTLLNQTPRSRHEILKRIQNNYAECFFLARCHYNSARYYKKIDKLFAIACVIIPLVTSTLLLFSSESACDASNAIIPVLLGVLTSLIVATRRLLEIDTKLRSHETMSMFYDDVKRDIEYFLRQPSSSDERCATFEEMILGKLAALTMTQLDFPSKIEERTDIEMSKESSKMGDRLKMIQNNFPTAVHLTRSSEIVNTSKTNQILKDTLLKNRRGSVPSVPHSTDEIKVKVNSKSLEF